MNPLKRYAVQIGEPAAITLALVGCGGTGSFAALHLARLAYESRRSGLELDLVFIDPDVVEDKNIGRQNFCPPEIGQPKAYALASRYNLAFGLEIGTIQNRVGRLDLVNCTQRYNSMLLVVGCVDSPAARREIVAALAGKGKNKFAVWWLDAGNSERSGQVLIGNGDKLKIDEALGCVGLPWPSEQEPGIVTPPPTPPPAGEGGLSCAEALQANVQSLMINQAMAGWLGVYASRLLLSRDLDIYQTWLDLQGGSARSVAISPASAAGEVDKVARGQGDRVTGWQGDRDETEIGSCPQCQGVLVTAQNNDEDEGVIDIAFCPACGWFAPLAEWQADPRVDEAAIAMMLEREVV